MNTDQGGSEAIACTLDAADLGERSAEWESLSRNALVAASRTGESVRLTYANRTDVAIELKRLVELERACCPFLSWDITQSSEELLLTVSGSGEPERMLKEFMTTARGHLGSTARPS